jgi:serine/threonine protein kinase
LSGLNFLHNCNQIHRDIKPANILINHEGVVKISDLGILKKIDPIIPVGTSAPVLSGTYSNNSKLLPTIMSGEISDSPIQNQNEEIDNAETKVNDSSNRLDIDEKEMFRANTFVGTVSYMAPERIDSRPYTFNSDVWSFGLTMMAVALGRLPIDVANGFWSVLNAVRDREPPKMPDDGHWSSEFRDFISQCLTQSPATRPSCAVLLQHPFIKRATPDTFEEDLAHKFARGSSELKSIIHALYDHLKKVEVDYSRLSTKTGASTANITNAVATNHVLAHAIEAQGVDEVLRLLLFGKEPSLKGDALLEATHTRHRLAALADQLHIPLRATLLEARHTCNDIFGENRIIEEDVNNDDLYIGETPKARHDMKKVHR